MAKTSRPTNRSRKIAWLGLCLGVVLVLLAFGANKTWRVIVLSGSLQTRLDLFQTAMNGEAELGLGEAGESLRAAQAELDALQNEVGFLLPQLRHFAWMPAVGGDLEAAPMLFELIGLVTKAGTVTFDALEPLVALTEHGDPDGKLLGQTLDVLVDAGPELEDARTLLMMAQKLRHDIDVSALSRRTAAQVARVDRYLPLMQSALQGARVLPDLLGASESRSYLILAQNNDELRASGGFISAVGRLKVNGGEIESIVFEDSYVVDDFSHPYPDSPPPVLRYMGIDQWVFRDANWSPDFPTSAQKAVELYRISRELEVDGVLAVDQHALQAIVGALAPLEIGGWPEPVTDENVVRLIRLAWSPDEAVDGSGFDRGWWQQRKSFIGDLISAIQTRLETSPDEVNWLALARALVQVLDQRHVQVWLADAESAAADLLADQGWDGAIRQVAGDYLMVVDTNMGYNKANAVVQQSLDYRVLINAAGTAQATLTVRHVNPSTETAPCDPRSRYGTGYDHLINRCYWDYVRVYAPAASQLYAATAHPVSADLLITQRRQTGEAESLPEEKGKAVFASFFVLPHGQESQSRFVYQLPPGIPEHTDSGWRYRLLVQKHAGTDSIPVRVTLKLPPGARAHPNAELNGVLGEASVQWTEPDTLVFDTTLDRDRVFDIAFRLNDDHLTAGLNSTRTGGH